MAIDRKRLEAIINEADDSGGEDYDPKMMLFLVAAAKESGVDLADKESLSGFVDSLKALITRDKAQLTAALRKYARKDVKQLSKMAMKA